MSLARSHRTASVVLLVVLVALTTIEVPLASARILWRYVVLSFDNPATQVLDELVCESSPPSQAGVEAGQSTRLAATSGAGLSHCDTPSRLCSPALSSGITRSPPIA